MGLPPLLGPLGLLGLIGVDSHPDEVLAEDIDQSGRVVRVHRVDPYLRAVLAEGLVWVLAAWYGWVGTPHIPGPVLLHRCDNDSPRVRCPR